ncbi:MAG: hypothetical protein GX768_06170 [Chloroflexi bacterium]|nr:hypothetical protein [Chloroflexota bacterium]
MVKALIINRSKPGNKQADALRFLKLIKTLKKGGINASYHDIETKNKLLDLLAREQPEIVYCANYFVTDEDGGLVNAHALLDQLGVCRVGSTVNSLELVLSKSALKKQWVQDQVSTPRFFVINKINDQERGLETALQAADYPYILKPDLEGNSRGLDSSSVVFDEESFINKTHSLLERYEKVMVEKFLNSSADFHEYTVGLIGGRRHQILMPTEIQLKQKKRVRLITTADKEQHRTQTVPVKGKVLREKLSGFAKQAFSSAGVSDYARLDMIMANGALYAIEINGLPMIPDKWFEACAKGVRLSEDQYLNAIFLSCILRNQAKAKKIRVPVEMRRMLPQQVFASLGA